MKYDRKSYILAILTIIGVVSFAGIAFADSEIGDRIVSLWYHGNISNTTGYNYSNLTNVPIGTTQTFTANGVLQNYTITNSYIANSTKVYVNGIRQTFNNSYMENVSMHTVNFTWIPSVGMDIEVDYVYQ